MRVLIPLFALLAIAIAPEVAFAADADTGRWGIGLGTGILMGLAVLGGGIAQGNAVANTVQGIARNPGAAGQVQVPMIVGLAFIESLVLFALVISFMLMGNL
jgi:F-type H+-transporting ATPase subunit c